MKRILVPLDGSEFAQEALGPAIGFAKRHGAEIHLVSVVSNAPPVPLAFADETLLSGWREEEEARVQEYLDGVLARIATEAVDVQVTAEVRVGRVSATVQEVADELQSDLVVLTTHGRGAFQRAWLGSTADQLIRRIERPLLLLPHSEDGASRFEADALRHVLVPLDGSEAAEAALEALPRVLSAAGGARLTLASVVAEGFPLPVYLPHVISEEALGEQRRERAKAYLDQVAARTEPEGIGIVETRVITAEDPAQGLLRFCDEIGVQLIAFSTHGRGGMSRLFLGSVADKLIRGARVPVLVTRRPGDERE